LYKGYVPQWTSTDNRIVDTRISKYETKLRQTDEIAFLLYQVERENRGFAKVRGKRRIVELLEELKTTLTDDGLNKHQKLVDKINIQLKTYG
tara:strand:- start:218 stop:493 length:276 start_codon:yes stop_codon:yes gene_type:complete